MTTQLCFAFGVLPDELREAYTLTSDARRVIRDDLRKLARCEQTIREHGPTDELLEIQAELTARLAAVGNAVCAFRAYDRWTAAYRDDFRSVTTQEHAEAILRDTFVMSAYVTSRGKFEMGKAVVMATLTHHRVLGSLGATPAARRTAAELALQAGRSGQLLVDPFQELSE